MCAFYTVLQIAEFARMRLYLQSWIFLRTFHHYNGSRVKLNHSKGFCLEKSMGSFNRNLISFPFDISNEIIHSAAVDLEYTSTSHNQSFY